MRPLWTVTVEPILSEFFNPKAKHMYRGCEREATRLGWSEMLARGQARMVRRRAEGGYFTILTPPVGTAPTKRVAFRSQHVHVAVGYPSLRFLPDLQDYRARHNDSYRVVNAYEQHSHVYESISRGPATVVVRGAGIVASRILERLIDTRRSAGTPTVIVHLLRTFVDGPTGGRLFRREGADGFAYQPFTFTKAAGSGQHRQRTLALEGDERAAYIKTIGGTTTSKRKVWQRQLERGRREGWYQLQIGEVKEVVPDESGQKVVTTVGAQRRHRGPHRRRLHHRCHRPGGSDPGTSVLADLLDCGGASTNAFGRLDVDPYFEIRGTRSGTGRMFASGSIAAGGYLAPADSFWGVQHAALEIADALRREGFCRRIGPIRSITSWWRWMRRKPI